MLSPENVATPATAGTIFVPASVPVLGFVPIATVTFTANAVRVVPEACSAVTSTPYEITAPAAVVLGSTENTSCVAAPGVLLTAAWVALPGPVAGGVYPAPPLWIASSENVAPPAVAATVAVPASVPLPGFVPIATVTF